MSDSFHESFGRDQDIHGSSNRSFGLVFAAVLAFVTVYQAVLGALVLAGVAAGLGLGLLTTALFRPALLAPFNRLWTRFGLLLHKIVSPVVLGVMFYGAVLPIGLVMRGLGHDPLRRRFKPEAQSYWIVRCPPGPDPKSMTEQF